MLRRTLLPLLLFLCGIINGQDNALTDSLKVNLENSKTAKEKVKWLGKLAAFYKNLNPELSEKYTKQLFETAELSRDRKLLLDAYLNLADAYYNSGGTQEHLNRAKNYSQQALEVAKESHLDEYIAWGYIYVSRGFRNEGQNDKALSFSNLALSLSNSLENDSLKISAINNLGRTYLAKKEKLLAFRNFIQAMNLAEKIRNYEQMKVSYYIMADFYEGLDDYEKSKDYLFKIFKLTKQRNERWDRLDLYNTLGTTYRNSKQPDLAFKFYDQAMGLADSLGITVYKINIYARIFDLYFTTNQPAKALEFFNQKPELKNFMIRSGVGFFIDFAYAMVYNDLNKFDSAQYYFKKSETEFEAKANSFNKYFFYSHYGQYYSKTHQYKKSIEYWEKARQIGLQRDDISLLKTIAQNLDSVYQKVGDFKTALFYNAQFHVYKDSLAKLSTERDLMLLEVDNENKRKQQELMNEIEATRERHNIQYMGITAGIAGVFIVLVMLGIFSVSKSTIKILGFFAFIFLFEFLILLADNQIHHWTHGEPWKVLLIKIGLISILLPLHHFLEERVIHYLTSKKRLQVSAKELLSKISGKDAETLVEP